MDLTTFSLFEAHQKILKREVSSLELTQAVLDRIDRIDPKIGAYLHVCADHALKQARSIDDEICRGAPILPLTGIPIALKDIFLTRGIPTTCSSKILENYLPPYEGGAVEKLRAQGMVLLGKLNMDEFAMGSSSETSHYQKTLNPWDLTRTPGGSSGGSSAAVSADLCFAALGTDTGGSIRQPAALCSIVGLKPTYGRVSRYGVIAFASSLDQVGPMTKDVRDAAVLLQAIAGHDPNDATSLSVPVPNYTQALERGVKGLRIGIPKEYFGFGIDEEVRSALEKAILVYEQLGATCEEVSLPHTRYGVPTYYILAPAEASSNLARYDGIRFGYRSSGSNLEDLYIQTRTEGFGEEVKRRILLGTYVLSAGYYDAYYLKAQKVRTLIRHDFDESFKSFDLLLTPVSPTPAFRVGEKIDDPLKMYLSDIFTINVNLAGLPAISLPCGFSKTNLPIGMQLIAPALAEEKLFQAAYAYEQETPWHQKRPDLF